MGDTEVRLHTSAPLLSHREGGRGFIRTLQHSNYGKRGAEGSLTLTLTLTPAVKTVISPGQCHYYWTARVPRDGDVIGDNRSISGLYYYGLPTQTHLLKITKWC